MNEGMSRDFYSYLKESQKSLMFTNLRNILMKIFGYFLGERLYLFYDL